MGSCRLGGARRAAGLAAVVLGLLGSSFVSAGHAGRLMALSVAVGPDADTLDPRHPGSGTAASIAGYVFETLLGPSEEGAEARRRGPAHAKLIPRLATSWRVSADRRTYTFTLRRGVTFQDGAPFDAAAVKANIGADPRVPASGPSAFADIAPDRIETPDPHTLVVHLMRPDPMWLPHLAGPSGAIVSPRTLTRHGDERLGRAPVDAGTGPYRVREWVPGRHITLVRNPFYWGRSPAFDRVVFRMVPEPSAREALLRSGAVQMAVGLPGTDVSMLRRDAALRVLEERSDEVIFLSLNTQWGPLRDVRVRRALNYAVNKNAIIRTLLPGLADVLDSPLPPVLSGHAAVAPGGWPYDPLMARRLLAEAGYPHGFGVILGTPLGWYTEDYQVAVAVAKQLENVGVTTPTLGISASDVFVGGTQTYLRWLGSPPNWTPPQMILGGWASPDLDADGELCAQFTRSQWPPRGNADSYYENPRVEALLRAARRTEDTQARRDLSRRAQVLIWQDAPWIFLWAQHLYVATSAHLHGVTLMPTGRWAGAYAEWQWP